MKGVPKYLLLLLVVSFQLLVDPVLVYGGFLSSSLSTTPTKTFVSKSSTRLQVATSVEQQQQPKQQQNSNQQQVPLAPLTFWGNPISDIRSLQQQARQQRASKSKSSSSSSDAKTEFAIEISATKDLQLKSIDEEIQYFQDNAMQLKYMMQEYGCVVFRDFQLMKTQDGFQQFYNTIGMKPCLDPLHSVSARPTIDGTKNSPIYEAVNKESRKNFFIGMHNEFVGTRAPRAAAFVCFKAAEVGGEFIVADGRRIFEDVDSNLLVDLYNKQIRYSVMELPFFDWIYKYTPSPIQQPIEQLIGTIVSAAINAKVDFSVDMSWQSEGSYATEENTNTNSKFLQARAPRQPPVVLHPITNEPTWFCNVHSHSSTLRRERESIYGAERFEDGASRINKSDMYFGDDTALTKEQLQLLDSVTKQHMKYIKMKEGDVVLLDNYKTMHGRNVFDGTRKHGVCWFEGWDGEEEMIVANKEKIVKQDSSTTSSVPFFAMTK